MAAEGLEAATLDLSDQGLEVIEVIPGIDPVILIYDRNLITSLNCLEHYPNVLQLSVSENRISDIGSSLSCLTCLTVLNLSHNNITKISGLQDLRHLMWLSLSSNNIKVIEDLDDCLHLEHVDLSHNSIHSLSDLSCLTHLQTLLLHGNVLTTLRSAAGHLPPSLQTLSLADNHIADLNEVAYLTSFVNLEDLSLMNNPCVILSPANLAFDYRPFIVNWCMNLQVLDGYVITEKEGLKAEWLYSQGKGRHFRPGQHMLLIQYLSSASPLTTSIELERAEDVRLSKVLQCQRALQQQLQQQENSAESVLLQAGLPLSSSPQSPAAMRIAGVPGTGSTAVPGAGQGDRPSTAPASSSTPLRCSGDTDRPLTAAAGSTSPRAVNANDMELVDVHSSDESTSHLLEAETRYLPLHSELNTSPLRPFNMHQYTQNSERPQTAPSQAGDVKPSINTHKTDPPSQADTSSELRPSSAGDVALSRPAQALNQGHVRRLAANFANMEGGGKSSEQRAPSPAWKRPSSPASKMNDVLHTDSESDNTAQSESTHPTLELKLLKAILADRRSKKSIRKSLQQVTGGNSDATAQDGNSTSSLPSSSSPRTPYKTQYSPEKYTSPIARSDSKSSDVVKDSDRVNYEGILQGEKPYGSSGAVPCLEVARDINATTADDSDKALAATRLQALWRGYLARHRNPAVVKIRQEIRARRAEDHIRYLRHELDRQRQLYEQEKHLRTLQLDALKYLSKEVQSLQQWKSQVLVPPSAGAETSSSAVQTTQHLLQTLNSGSESVAIASHSPTTATSQGTAASSQKEAELENACKSLQKQVLQLQEVLSSMSGVVFQGGVINASTASDSKETTGKTLDGNIRLSTDFELDSLADTTDTVATSTALDTTATASISVGSMSLQTPYPGAPTCPTNLRMQQYGACSIVLHWMPSLVLDSTTHQSTQPVIGYRIFVNGIPKGMVAGTQTRALLEGLLLGTLYRVYVKAVSAVGESFESNTVEFTLKDPSSKDDKDSVSQGGDDEDDGGRDGGTGIRRRPSDGHDSGGASDDDQGGGGCGASSGPSNTSPLSSSTPNNHHTACLASSALPDAPSPINIPLSTKPKVNSQPNTPKFKGDFHSEFVKERSRSDDSGYWTSPSTALPQQPKENKPLKVIHPSQRDAVVGLAGQTQDDMTGQVTSYDTALSRKSKRVNALLERLEQKKFKNPQSKPDSTRGEERTQKASEDNKSLLRVSTEGKVGNSPRRKMSPDIPMKAFPKSSQDTDSTTCSEAEKAFRKAEQSKIPIYTRKSGRGSSKSTRGSISDSELGGKAYQDFKGDSSGEQADVSDLHSEKSDTLGTCSGPLQAEIASFARRHSDSATVHHSDSSPRAKDKSSRPASYHSDRKSPSCSPREAADPTDVSLNLPKDDTETDASLPMFKPKPPEGSCSPRKPAMSRRNSLRRRHNSGQSETATKVCESSDLEDSPSVTSSHSSSSAATPASPAAVSSSKQHASCETSQHSSIPVRKDRPNSSNFRRDDASRGRISVRESKKPKEVKSQRRSSSVGAIMSKLTGGCCSVNTVIATDKPPLATPSSNKPGVVVEKPPIGRSSREPSTERRREGSSDRRREGSSERRHRRTTKSEQAAASDTDDNHVPDFYQERRRLPSDASSAGKSSDSDRESSGEAAYAVVRKIAQDGRGRDATPKKKPFSSQKRSGSDFSGIPVLPDRPESPAPREKRPATPNTPTQAPSSPRVRRSSSFSKALPDDTENPEKVMLRQCISLETLKAVKSQEMKKSQEVSPSNGSQIPVASSTNPTKPTIYSHRRVASSGQLQDFLNKKTSDMSPQQHRKSASAATEYADAQADDNTSPIRRRVSMRDDKLRAAIERVQASKTSSSQAAAEAPDHVKDNYSPKLSQNPASDAKSRKIKIPNRAADLFAKLQVKLSASKMS